MRMCMGGSIYNSMRYMKLSMKWDQRKNNISMKKGDEDPQMEKLRRQAESVRDNNAVTTLDNKLKAGAALTAGELDYLRVHSPQLYREAMDIKQERERYKRELQGCKTKDEVDRLNQRKIQQFATEVRAVEHSNLSKGKKLELIERICRRNMGIRSEHAAFVKTEGYTRLPSEDEMKQKKSRRESAEIELERAEREDGADPPPEQAPQSAPPADGPGPAEPAPLPDERQSAKPRPIKPAASDAAGRRTYNARGEGKTPPTGRAPQKGRAGISRKA